MTRRDTAFHIILLFVLAITMTTLAMAQDGEHAHPATDEAIDALAQQGEDHAAAIARMEAEIANLRSSYEIIQNWNREQDARLDALEGDGGTPPPVIDPDPERRLKIQVGPWIPGPFNIEAPFIDILHASAVKWSGAGMQLQELLDKGFIDPVSLLPVRLPASPLTSTVYFTGDPRTRYDGEWVLEWCGDADLSMLYVNAAYQRRVGPNRIEFTRNAADGLTPNHAAVQVLRLGEPLTCLRLFAKENEDLLASGRLYNPNYLSAAGRYDVIRTMDLQEANRANITRLEDLAGEATPFWNNLAWQSANNSNIPVRSVPLKAVFALGVESGSELWVHVPMTLGAPKGIMDPAIMVAADKGAWLDNWSAMARDNAPAILASPEWDRYADAFVAALVASGYPSWRTLYVAIDNEVWNNAAVYAVSTRYAGAIGQGLGVGSVRQAYGVLTVRWAMALERALNRAGRIQKTVILFEGQAANPSTTRQALEGAAAYMEAIGEVWENHAPHFAVVPASYWGSKKAWDAAMAPAEWSALIASDPDEAGRRMTDFLINGPADVLGTRGWILTQFAAHAREAGKFGVKLAGAYEGGSGHERPDYIPKEFYAAWLWGPGGAAVNAAVQDALGAAYPDFILSNYVMCGPTGGQPWFDGECPADNPLAASWEPYMKDAN